MYSLSYFIFVHEVLKIAYPSRTRVTHEPKHSLTHSSLCGPVAEDRSAEFRYLRYDSTWLLKIFLSFLDKAKIILLYIGFLS